MYLMEQMTNPCTQGKRATRRLVFVVFAVYIPADGMGQRQQGTVVFGEQGPQLGKVSRCLRRKQKSKLPLKARYLVLARCVPWGYILPCCAGW